METHTNIVNKVPSHPNTTVSNDRHQFLTRSSTDVNTPLRVKAYHLADKLKLKSLINVLDGTLIESSSRELQIKLGEDRFLFVYRFGCLVFINVPDSNMQELISKLNKFLKVSSRKAPTETYEITLGQRTRVEFEHVEIRELNREKLRMICLTVAQSAALEYYELISEKMLDRAGSFIRQLTQNGVAPLNSRKLLKHIGANAEARQHIISHLAVLDAPEETWENEELESLFAELQEQFEIHLRFKALDRKLSLIQDNLEIMAELTSAKRGHFLEIMIVLLILIEIGLAGLGWF